MTVVKIVPSAKVRLCSTLRSTIGSGVCSSRITNSSRPTELTAVRIRIKCESNQSSRSPFQHHLQAGEANHQQPQSPPVNGFDVAAEVSGIMYEHHHHRGGNQPDRHVDVED